jgi:cyclopropane fatty-acyl-phospholipid synthase-like methyltransferase
MNVAELSAICHAGLPFANPLSEDKVDELIGSLALGAGARVLDVGAGNGEILRRIVGRYGVTGIGLDPASPPTLDERAELRRARIEELTERDFDAVVNVAASHAFGRWHDALAGLADLVRPGGFVLFGEGYWRRQPSPAYLEALGATADELPYGLGDLVRGGEAHGLHSVHLAVASEDDWDRYEWRLIRNGERAAAQLGEDPDAAQLRAWVARARDRVLGEGGRDTLGFALVLFTRR